MYQPIVDQLFVLLRPNFLKIRYVFHKVIDIVQIGGSTNHCCSKHTQQVTSLACDNINGYFSPYILLNLTGFYLVAVPENTEITGVEVTVNALIYTHGLAPGGQCQGSFIVSLENALCFSFSFREMKW